MIAEEIDFEELEQIEPGIRSLIARYIDENEATRDSIQALISSESKEPKLLVRLLHLYADHTTFRMADFEEHSLSSILDYLRKTHAYYQNRIIPKMEMCIDAIERNFPDHPIAGILDTFFKTYRNELLEHIELEENKLFPYAECLYDGNCKFEYSIKEFKLQHDHHIEDDLGKILKVLESEYPEVARSFSYRTFRSLLEQLEKDLFVHHLIEERVFVTRVHDLELQATRNIYQ